MGALKLQRFKVRLSSQRQVITGMGVPKPISFEAWDGSLYITALVEPGCGFEFSRGIYICRVGGYVDKACTFIGAVTAGEETLYAFMEGM